MIDGHRVHNIANGSSFTAEEVRELALEVQTRRAASLSPAFFIKPNKLDALPLNGGKFYVSARKYRGEHYSLPVFLGPVMS